MCMVFCYCVFLDEWSYHTKESHYYQILMKPDMMNPKNTAVTPTKKTTQSKQYDDRANSAHSKACTAHFD